jgi:hypothetical protein
MCTTFSGKRYFPAPLRVSDAPDMGWRGLLLDVSRNFHPLENVLSLLDGMEFVKLNVLHFHLCDDQGFRMESRRFPKLHEVASEGQYFTQEQIRIVVREAALRGIRVVPEFDMPGHAGAFLLAYPELGAHNGTAFLGPKTLYTKWGISEWVLDATSDAVYKFVEEFVAEVVELFPDRYYHIGGDEVPHSAWTDSKTVARMKNMSLHTQHDLQLYFNQKTVAILAAHNKTMVGWDEILTKSLPKDVVVQLWRGWVGGLAQDTARLGLKSISSKELYLDWVRPAKHYYKQSVLEPVTGRMGGEACMWSEWAQHNIDNRIWPTLAVIAERLWLATRPAAAVSVMYGRLFAISNALNAVGIRHQAVYEQALSALLTEKPYNYKDVEAQWNASNVAAGSPPADSPEMVLVRRLANALQPINRVGGENRAFRHDLLDVVDALRPDSMEMRALELLLDQVVEVDKFQDANRVGLVHAYLQQYAQLRPQFEAASLFSRAPLAKAREVVSSIASVAEKAAELLESLSKADVKAAAAGNRLLLQLVARVEDAKLDGDSVIIELAHVVETRLCKKLPAGFL